MDILFFFPDHQDSISPVEKGVLDTTHNGEDNTCYIAIGVDEDAERLFLSSITSSYGISYSEANKIYLQPALPAKGTGMLEVRLHQKAESYPDGILWASSYSEELHSWLRDVATNISDLIGLEYEELPEFHDC